MPPSHEPLSRRTAGLVRPVADCHRAAAPSVRATRHASTRAWVRLCSDGLDRLSDVPVQGGRVAQESSEECGRQ
eukprot:7580075-Pyramimonas_sp.AAC.1